MANGDFPVKSADVWESDYCRFARMRNPNAKTGPNEYYNVQAKNLASSMLVVLSNYAQRVAGKISLQDMTGSQLDDAGRPVSEGGLGVPRPDAIGSSGTVAANTTLSGSIIEAGDELTSEAGVAYRCQNTKRYYDGDSVSIICKETGPGTNLPVGAKLTWSNPRPGCFAVAVVLEQNGAGLIGGSEAMGDDDYRELLADAQANPAASANDAYLHKLIRDARAHGIAVERSFTWPCARGPATNAFTFTLRGSAANSSRLPSPSQLDVVAAYVTQYLPYTDGLFKVPLVSDSLKLSFRVKWHVNGWADTVQWPPYLTASTRCKAVGGGTAVSFSIATSGVGVAAPIAGQSIGLFNASTGKVVRKTISAVSGTGPWSITCETKAEASDVSYVPLADQWVMPWSDSLQTIADVAIAYVNSMGPGEINATLPEDGVRGARSPADEPGQWPAQMDSHLLGAITDLTQIKRATHEDGFDYIATVGSIAVANLPTLTDLAVFPL
jgi:hypothetical protein